MAICLAGSLAAALLGPGCAGPQSGGGGTSSGGSGGSGGTSAGGTTGSGGFSSALGGSGGAGNNGGSSGSGGVSSNGGSGNPDAPISSGGSGGSNSGGATFNSGGSTGKGGAGGNGGSGGSAGSGGTAGSGGSAGTRAGGASGSGGRGGSGGVGGGGQGGADAAMGTDASPDLGPPPIVYELPPPDQCHDVDQMPWSSDPKTGCVEGDTTSKCGGKCQTASVCEDPSAKPNADREYMCPRNLLFSPEMEQAVKDDGLDGFHYAVVGHDPDKGGIDGNSHSCCQCYQLVYAYPSPNNDRQVQLNPDNPNPPASAIPIPPPLIVQSFNTAATITTFDVYMPAGGMGAQNGCFLLNSSDPAAKARKYMYTSYPLDGQPGSGGVKPASLYQECKTTDKNWVTEATITSAACVKRTTDACNKIASNIPGLTELGSTGCLKANTIDTFYHLNWSVYAMKVECPEHLTRVTGCRLAKQSDTKTVKKDVKTAAQAAKDTDFWSKTASSSGLYETTTMEDCCRPTCASYSQISSFGLTTDPQYRSFYNCDANGVPWTQPQ